MKSNLYYHFMVFIFLLLLVTAGLAVSQRDVKTAGNQATDQKKHKTLATAYDLRMPFITNEGQGASGVGFYAKIFGGTVYVTKDGEMVYSLVKNEQRQINAKALNEKKDPYLQVCVLRERLFQARKISPAGVDKSATRINYFIGSNQDRWRNNIPGYNSVSLGEVYDHIDLVLRAHGNNAEKIFTVHPGGKVADIRLTIDGASSLAVTSGGELEIDTGSGTVNFSAPVAFQEIEGKRQEVQVAYALKGKTYGFQAGEYNRESDLIIDPALVYSKILGGFQDEYGYGIALDSSGNAYVAGYTRSDDFPTQNPYDATKDGYWDAFVSKFDSSGTLVYSTYLGGSDYDKAYGIAVDNAGNAYVTGETWSGDFPTQNPYDSTLGGYIDTFVTKLNASGSALAYSTYLGGSESDYGYGIAVDNAGNIYVTGLTDSTDFPIQNAMQPNYAGGYWDGFVTKLDSSGTLDYSTYLGGSGNWDRGWDIAVDSAGNAYVTGSTNSDDFPSQNPYDSTLDGSFDAFVSKLSASGALDYSTYLGGSESDYGYGIAVDNAGNAYVTGSTNSANFPTQNPYDSTLGGDIDTFVTKLNASGSALAYSTYLGGSESDYGYGIALDSAGNAYVTGPTVSIDFPTLDPFQHSYGGSQDAFVTKLNTSGSALAYSTFLGKSYSDIGRSIAVDNTGNAYVTGETGLDFPADNTAPVKRNAFVSKFASTEAIGSKAMPWILLLLDY